MKNNVTVGLHCLWVSYLVSRWGRPIDYQAVGFKLYTHNAIQELISRLDSRTLPLEPHHSCTSSVLSTCLQNDVLASCLPTKHTPDDVIVTHALLLWFIDRPHLQWPWTIRFQGNASTLNIVIFINHTWRQTDNANIRGKKLQNKSKKEIYVINSTPSR